MLYERPSNQREDFPYKPSRFQVNNYYAIYVKNLNISKYD
jgi:hypothetical protein